MKINLLDIMPLEVRNVQSLDKHSKEYKKAIKNFRFKYKVLVGSPLRLKKDNFSTALKEYWIDNSN